MSILTEDQKRKIAEEEFRVQSDSLRDGIPVEKGVILTTDFIKDNQSLFEEWCNHFLMYPDLLKLAAYL